jgi:colanic acid biosynthesis protein WcaH
MYIPHSVYNEILKNTCVVCVDILIIYNDRILLLKRDNEPAKGQLWFPGGRILKMESIKEAAIRKSKEEVNLDCNFIKIVSIEETIFLEKNEMITDIHTINICCELLPVSVDDIKINNLHSTYKWYSLSDIYTCKLHTAVLNPILKVFQSN